MNTTIRFPADEIIEDVYVSDPVSFEAIVPRSNVVMVRVIRPGADGNLVAMGKSGNLYQFYVRGEGANTKVIRSEEHTSELQSLMRISYAVFCLKKKTQKYKTTDKTQSPRQTISSTYKINKVYIR